MRHDFEPDHAHDSALCADYADIPRADREEGLIDPVDYIKQLNSNYRIQQTLNRSQVQNHVQTSMPASAQHAAAAAPGMVKP